jgi:FK506-binding nuclear protein
MAAFWGFIINAGESKEIEIPEESFVTISQAALTKAKTGQSVEFFCEVDDEKFLICTLSAGRVDQQPLNLSFPFDQKIKLTVSGEAGEVHLTGSIQPLMSESDDENGFQEMEDSEVEDMIKKKEKNKGRVVELDNEGEEEKKNEENEESEEENEENEEENQENEENEESGEEKKTVKKRTAEQDQKAQKKAKIEKMNQQKPQQQKQQNKQQPKQQKKQQQQQKGSQHTCSDCSKSFQSAQSLQQHRQSKHKA